MTTDSRARARDFLLGEQQLTPAETEEALEVAATVLRAGCAQFDAAVRAGDAACCAERAHALKGNLLNLGLPELAALAARAMDLAGAGEFGALRGTAAALANALDPFWT